MEITTVAKLVRVARNNRSQKEFAQELGVKQSSVSRYESGKANPPIMVIEHCMRLVHWSGRDAIPTADELATKIQIVLADEGFDQVRLALAMLVDALANGYAETCAMSTASITEEKK